jgi:hypothetical protein
LKLLKVGFTEKKVKTFNTLIMSSKGGSGSSSGGAGGSGNNKDENGKILFDFRMLNYAFVFVS